MERGTEMAKRGGKQPAELPYSKDIEKKLIEMSDGGVTRRDMLAAIQNMKFAPRSFTTFYKKYGGVLSEHEAKVKGAVGKRVIDQALHGDPSDPLTVKQQQFYLERKGGWTNKVEVDIDPIDEDVDGSAIDALLLQLGFSEEDNEEDSEDVS